jgi:cytochrome c-type biogenesis protein CcmE
MNKKTGFYIGLLLMLGLIGLSAWLFVGTVTPYTTDFTQAMSGKEFQVNGIIDKETMKTVESDGKIKRHFTITDSKGGILPIVYNGLLPQNFAHADTAVATGKWNGKEFEATQVLVKCPSKYEEKNE